MPCEHRDGMIICTRGGSKIRCKYCGFPGNKLCDYPLSGIKGGKTCDAPMCEKCATHVPPDSDYCKPHAAMIATGVTLRPNRDGFEQ